MTKISCAWRLAAIASVAFSVAFLVVPGASAGTITLGTAANYAVFGSAGTETITNSLVTINGNEGISAGGSIANNAPSIINGNVYESSSGQYSGPGKLNGSLITNSSLLTTNNTDLTNALTAMGGLTTNAGTLSGISSATTIGAVGTQTVVDVSGNINLNNANLTINGASGDQFIIRVNGGMNMMGTASVLLTGGVTANDVFFDFTGSSGDTISTKVGDTLNGVYIAENESMTLDGSWNGEIIGDEGITLMSAATVTAATAMPEGASSAVTLLMVLVCLVGCSAFKSIFRPT